MEKETEDPSIPASSSSPVTDNKDESDHHQHHHGGATLLPESTMLEQTESGSSELFIVAESTPEDAIAVSDADNAELGETQSKSSDLTEKLGNAVPGRGLIDNSAPFESVKAAVSKFGGVADKGSQKPQTVEVNFIFIFNSSDDCLNELCRFLLICI